MEVPGIRCMVGYVWYLFKTIVIGTLSAIIGQLMKFGFVLLLTYMMGLGIFYMWENNIPIATAPQPIPRIPSISRGSISNPRRSGSYPFVVEIPVKKEANDPGPSPKTTTEPEVVRNVELPPIQSFVEKIKTKTSELVNRESPTNKLETDANETATVEENENADADDDADAKQPPPTD